MCGIHVVISRDAPSAGFEPHSAQILQRLASRGPDHQEQYTTRFQVIEGDDRDGTTASISFASSVLSLRGDDVTEQPFVDSNPVSGSVLCWNGEVWFWDGSSDTRHGYCPPNEVPKGSGWGRDEYTTPVEGNDGAGLFRMLRTASRREPDAESLGDSFGKDSRVYPDAVLHAIRRIGGPFAFVYFDLATSKIYFGRDRLGRRSLLTFEDSENGRFIISSVAESADPRWKEADADGIYEVDLSRPWKIAPFDEHLPQNVLEEKKRHEDGAASEETAGESRTGPRGEETSLSPRDGCYHLNPVTSYIPKADCTDIMANEQHPHIIRHDWFPDGAEDLIYGFARFNSSTMNALMSGPLSTDASSFSSLSRRLDASVQRRVIGIPAPPRPAADRDVRVAVLFSGGLDCTVLANLCSKHLPLVQGIDLINVAFENPRLAAHAGKQGNVDVNDLYEACPDRVTGRKSFAELQLACPGRVFRFVAANIPYTETVSHRPEIVSLMYPHNTEMDFSIACALYFAARGQGLLCPDLTSRPIPYTTPARVLISGFGADELFGGYKRHSVAYSRGGEAALAQELELDFRRMGKRNLGRDDRVMAHWGREVRFPYLDEQLVRDMVQFPAHEKCQFGIPTQHHVSLPGDKRVLRLLAEHYGMPNVAREEKRAIQFGSRTAKMESGRTKGTSLIEEAASEQRLRT